MKVFHLHLHGKYLPTYKQFFSSIQDAKDEVFSIITKFFAYDDWLKCECVGIESPVRIDEKYETDTRSSYTITEIDSDMCPNYTDLFLEAPLTHKDSPPKKRRKSAG